MMVSVQLTILGEITSELILMYSPDLVSMLLLH